MYFGFSLDSSDMDLRNIDFLDAHLDLLDTDIPSKHFAHLQDVSSRRFQGMSSRRLQDVLDVTIFCLPRRLQDIFKTCLQNVFKTSWKTKNCYAENVLKTSSRRVLKTF